jgi:hypothetical protein
MELIVKNYKILIDNEDLNLFTSKKWTIKVSPRNKYVRSSCHRNAIFLHHLILNCFDKHIDHINGNGLDNRKSNLRIATRQQNAHNSRKRLDNKSGYKGVYKFQNKWRAMIGLNYKRIHLGLFDNIEDAAKAYDKAAIKYHKEFANLNFKDKK